MADMIERKLMISSVLAGLLQDFSSKSTVLNYIFRRISFIDSHEQIIVIPDQKLRYFSREVKIPFERIEQIVTDFLINTICFIRLLSCREFSWANNLNKLRRKLKIYLHKAYRIAPVFDYERARINSEILIQLMRRECYYPCFTTQLALVLFVTDANNPQKVFNTPILQKNLRAFCSCSAYAFHRARNKLQIDGQGKIN
jgi:hypothetical protein